MQNTLNELNCISISLTNTFTTELECIRIGGFGERYGTNLTDDADSHSYYIIIQHEQRIIATVRITPRIHSILDQWFGGKFPHPNNPYTAELTRGVVHNNYQGFGFYKLLMSKALISYPQLGFNTAVCAARIDLPQLPFLHALGFTELGQTTNITSKSKLVTLQPLVLNINENLNKIKDIYQTTLKQLRSKGIEVKAEKQVALCAEIAV